MTAAQPTPTTLLGLLASAPGEATAIALPDHNLRISYAQLRAQVSGMAGALAAAGIRRGDRVGMALPNGLPTIVAFLAAAEAGTAAPLNPGYKEEEFRFFLEDTSAVVLLLPPDGLDEARKAAGDVPILTVDMDASGTLTLGGKPLGGPVPSPAVDDVALILHTSGSTGRPKRVPLSHANLSISAHNVAATYALTRDDVSLCVMPLFHVHGLVASTLATLASGGTVVVPNKFSPLSFWRVAKEYDATWYSAVPTIHQLLLARVEPGAAKPAGAEKLRFIRSCSASLPPQVMHDLEAAFGAPVLEAYGMTEAAHQMASNPLPPAARKPGAVGPGTNVGISIRDGNGQVLPAGERGEVCIHGPNVVDRLREQPRGQRHGVLRRLVPHRRSGLPRRRRLPDPVGPVEGDDQPRRREDLAARDRRGAARPPGGRRSGVLRRAAQDVGRGSGRCGDAQGRGHRGRAAGLLQGAAGRVQAAQADPHHRGDSAHRHRQDPASRRGAGVRTEPPREDRHRRRRRDRRLPRRQAGARRRRRGAVRARPAPAGDAGPRPARDRRRGAVRGAPAR